MSQPSRTCSVLICLLLSACQSCSTSQEVVVEDAPPKATPVSYSRDLLKGQPTLVVSVVFDQLGADTLERLLPKLSPDGALRTAAEQGAFFPRVTYPHAVTLTAPGHALLYTGATPSHTGITGNLLARGGGRTSSSVEDDKHAVFGFPGATAGPGLLLAETVGDAYKQSDVGKGAQVISISLKDRGAVLPGGKHADLAIWYEAGVPGFTSSTYYGVALPPELTAYEQAHPLSELVVPWQTTAPVDILATLGPDAAPGEPNIAGFGETFPHTPGGVDNPAGLLRLTPALSEHLIGLTEAVANARQLGEDTVPDLLALSISGTDYAGHAYGPDSWEYFEHLKRADAALGAMLRRLAEKHTLTVLISSDHGVCRLPEQEEAGGRLRSGALAVAAEAALDAMAGDNAWVMGFSAPYLYLSEAAKAHADATSLRATACAAVAAQADVYAVYDVQQAGDPIVCKAPEGEAGDALLQQVKAGVHRERSGDFYVVPVEHYIVDESADSVTGTTHGSPWHYDRDVFVAAYGAGVEKGVHEGEFDTRSFAPTLSALLGAPAPNKATAKPLPGFTSYLPK